MTERRLFCVHTVEPWRYHPRQRERLNFALPSSIEARRYELTSDVGVHISQILRDEAGRSQRALDATRQLASVSTVGADEWVFHGAKPSADGDLRLHVPPYQSLLRQNDPWTHIDAIQRTLLGFPRDMRAITAS